LIVWFIQIKTIHNKIKKKKKKKIIKKKKKKKKREVRESTPRISILEKFSVIIWVSERQC